MRATMIISELPLEKQIETSKRTERAKVNFALSLSRHPFQLMAKGLDASHKRGASSRDWFGEAMRPRVLVRPAYRSDQCIEHYHQGELVYSAFNVNHMWMKQQRKGEEDMFFAEQF